MLEFGAMVFMILVGFAAVMWAGAQFDKDKK